MPLPDPPRPMVGVPLGINRVGEGPPTPEIRWRKGSPEGAPKAPPPRTGEMIKLL